MTIKQTFAMLVITGAVAVGCNQNRGTETTVTTDGTTDTTTITNTTNTTSTTVVKPAAGEYTTVTVDQLPAPVREAYTVKYPSATNVTWNYYTPVDDDLLDMTKAYYYANMNDAGNNYWVWYDEQGNWVRTEQKLAADYNLPTAVANTITTNHPGFEVKEIEIEEGDEEGKHYEIKLVKGEEKVKMKVLEDGTIFKHKVKN